MHYRIAFSSFNPTASGLITLFNYAHVCVCVCGVGMYAASSGNELSEWRKEWLKRWLVAIEFWWSDARECGATGCWMYADTCDCRAHGCAEHCAGNAKYMRTIFGHFRGYLWIVWCAIQFGWVALSDVNGWVGRPNLVDTWHLWKSGRFVGLLIDSVAVLYWFRICRGEIYIT